MKSKITILLLILTPFLAGAGITINNGTMSGVQGTGIAALANGLTGGALIPTNLTYSGSVELQHGTNRTYFNLLSSANASAAPGDKITIGPGNYFETFQNIVLTNNLTIAAYGANITISNVNAGSYIDITCSSNDTILGGVWNHLSGTNAGNVQGLFGALSGAFDNLVFRDVTMNSDAECFKCSALANSSAWFYNCRLNGDVVGFSTEANTGTLTNYIYNCYVIMTNTIQPLNNRAAFKIRGNVAGTYFIKNCNIVVSDAGITNFASGISSGHVPSGAGGSITNSFFADGLTFDLTSCTNPLSLDFNVHALTNAITLNNCWNVNGSRLSWSNYNSGIYPFVSNYYFTP